MVFSAFIGQSARWRSQISAEASVRLTTNRKCIDMYKATEVAWRMLKVAKGHEIQLSNLQLQKLVYIAHGYFLGWKNRPLVSEAVVAWKYGPVLDQVYHEFKSYQDRKIPNDKIEDIATELDADDDANMVIEGVLLLYGKIDAISLVNLTHQPETPWDEVWNVKGGSNKLSAEIPNDLIKNHFRKVINSPKSVKGL